MISSIDIRLMRDAYEISRSCPYTEKAYSVGAIITDENSSIISTGYSRETADNVHAEEVAIQKAINLGISLLGATIYSTMEPCGKRLSGKTCCADLIISSGIKRVVYGIKEPPLFVLESCGIIRLMDLGIIVEQVDDFNAEISSLNSHGFHAP